MANLFTGDFDATLEATVGAVNRILAAQHQARSYLHSFSIRIDDTVRVFHPSREVLRRAENLKVITEAAALTSNRREGVDVIDRSGCRKRGTIDPADYTTIRGFADIQISTPTITIPPAPNTSRLTVHFTVMVHFLADGGSTAMPEFLHGELLVTVDVTQIASQIGNVIEVDFKKEDIDVSFNTFWSDPALTPSQKPILAQLCKNLLRKKFEPVTLALPQDLKQVWTNMLPDNMNPGVALLLNLSKTTGPNPANITQIALKPFDDFALALSSDYVSSTLHEIIKNALAKVALKFDVDFVFTYHYQIQINNYKAELRPGLLLLTIEGRAIADRLLPSFDFRVEQMLTLSIVNGVIQVFAIGDPSVTILDGIVGWIISQFKGTIVDRLRAPRNEILANAQKPISDALDANKTLGTMLDSLKISAQLSYSFIEIQSDALILHGNLNVDSFQNVHAKFTSNSILLNNGSTEIELSALESWIPGGTIQQYIWKDAFDPTIPPIVEANRFITKSAATSRSFCLEVSGSRITNSGPPLNQPVSRTKCPLIKFIGANLVGYRLTNRLAVAVGAGAVEGRPGKITAFADPFGTAVKSARNGPNMVVHFSDSAEALQVAAQVREALAKSNKPESSLILIIVLPNGSLKEIVSVEVGRNAEMALTEDFEKEWSRFFRLEQTPSTFLVNPRGQTVWKKVGKIDLHQMTKAFEEFLDLTGSLRRDQLESEIVPGTPAPEFVFEYALDRCMALRKLLGRRLLLNFWTSWSSPSIEELHCLQRMQDEYSKDGLIVLAINDGDTRSRAAEVFEKHAFKLPLVIDVERNISRLYGINCWPTTVVLDENGIVMETQLGITQSHPLRDRQLKAARNADTSYEMRRSE